MKKKILIALIFPVIIILSSCDKTHNFIYSPDKQQCITIITDNNIRYVINGKHTSVPEQNYIKYSLDSIDLECGDQIVGCWKTKEYNWKLSTDNAVILENKLDTLLFKFYSNFQTDERGNPTIIDYSKEGCFGLDFVYKKLNHYQGVVVE